MSTQEVRQLIRELCTFQPLSLHDISAILKRHPRHVRDHYLNDMVKQKELEHVFADPNHPQQAYRAKNHEQV